MLFNGKAGGDSLHCTALVRNDAVTSSVVITGVD